MRETSAPGFRLSKSRRSLKILISLGMLGLLLGLLSSVLLTVSRTGLSYGAVTSYYLGITPDSGVGFDQMLTDTNPRPFAELLEVTHLHVLGCSMLLFLLCHLMSLVEISDSTRSALYLISFTSFLVTFALPWLIIYLSPVFAYCFGPAIVIFTGSLFVLVFLPLREMWIKPKK